ncbi:MAG: DUF3299 domain-containing protein [Gammaproteobacteria bacterium]|nr:DUF3299 domain-containing protein [Gammaproteobacteria bacterium]
MIHRHLLLLCITTLGLCAACDRPGSQQEPAAPAATAAVQADPVPAGATETQSTVPQSEADGVEAAEIEWDALVPADWQPEKLMAEYNEGELSDSDPRAQQLLDKLKALWKDAPVVHELEGRRVKIPGFVVPLEMDERKKIDQLLLVPYYGACIHVPPPPANQTIYVVLRDGKDYQGELFDVVWVTGTIHVERLSSELAEAGYRIDDALVTPYE